MNVRESKKYPWHPRRPQSSTAFPWQPRVSQRFFLTLLQGNVKKIATPNCTRKVQRQWSCVHSNTRYPDKFKQKRFLPSSLPSLRPPEHVSSYQRVITLQVLTTHIRRAVSADASVVPIRDKGCRVARPVLRRCQWHPPKVLIATHYRLRTLP